MEILRYAAFTDRPDGGNPAGVVLDADGMTAEQMQDVAARLGYAESAFVSLRSSGRASLRYFAPEAEIPFCGHATIATGVALAEQEGPGNHVLSTPVGDLELATRTISGRIVASIRTVEPWVTVPDTSVRADLLRCLGLREEDLAGSLPVLLAFSGNVHPIVPVVDAAVLRGLDYHYVELKELMAAQGWGATVTVVHRLGPDVFEARNPFPPGGVREDPATGSAAAALGAYLRHLGQVGTPSTITVHQGADVGRPSVLTVEVPSTGGLTVSGGAVRISE
jgi:PhzF family phenazine biosynthesis protein